MYVANRRANPIVSACGSSSASPKLERTNETSSARPLALVAHTSLGDDLATPAHDCLVGAIPDRADAVGQQIGDAVADPGVGVHAVGDRPDRHLVDRDIRPHALEHLAADGAVQLGDTVAAPGEAQSHHGHVEAIVVRLVGSLADGHQFVEVDAALEVA